MGSRKRSFGILGSKGSTFSNLLMFVMLMLNCVLFILQLLALLSSTAAIASNTTLTNKPSSNTLILTSSLSSIIDHRSSNSDNEIGIECVVRTILVCRRTIFRNIHRISHQTKVMYGNGNIETKEHTQLTVSLFVV